MNGFIEPLYGGYNVSSLINILYSMDIPSSFSLHELISLLDNVVFFSAEELEKLAGANTFFNINYKKDLKFFIKLLSC